MSEAHPVSFVHLRCHSEYSITDGIVRIDDYVEKASSENMPALALTDLNKDRKSTRLNSSHSQQSRMPSSA